MSQQFQVPFGERSLAFQLPDEVSGEVVTSRSASPIADETAAVEAALAQPIGAPPLCELARGARRVCIVVTDATRACPDHLLVPPMLASLAAAGVADENITLLVAVGVHRASTNGERREKLGDAIVDRFRVVDHDATDAANLVQVANGPEGVPFLINRLAVESDLLIATGRVEPHQYAGFSGGGKTVAIGCAGEAIIASTHGPAMLDREGVRLAELTRNPFQQEVRRVARAAGLRFVANVVMDDDDRLVAVAMGSPDDVQDHLAEIARTIFVAEIPHQFDIAVAGVGAPKDANLYQASRAASYLQFAPTPVVRRGGVIIIPARCPEGAGEGAGERRFRETMIGETPREIVRRARAEGIRPGEQRAFVMARVLEDAEVIFVGLDDPDEARAMGFGALSTMEEALRRAVRIVGAPCRALVVPHALATLPVVVGPARNVDPLTR